MTTRLLKANPAVNDDRGRVAFQRGPIVFCMEQFDQPDEAAAEQVSNLVGYTANLDGATSVKYEPDLLNGVLVLEHPGAMTRSSASDSLYYAATESVRVRETSATLRLIPYYAWANRAPTAMQVWVPYRTA